MIKKLDILIVKAFIGPFIATFFITLFVLILQFFWLWIDDFVGKGLDASIWFRLVIYLSATLVPLALPLAVLLSAIMTFGNLGETFELVAIKSAGIGLLRFMRPLFIVAILLSLLAFVFNNYMIPVANLKMRTLHTDIVNKKPAFDLKEGVFYTTIPGYAIKVGKKEKDDSTLTNVIIYEQGTNPLRDNIIIAKKGIMRVSSDKKFLEFSLKDGWRYEERGPRMTSHSDFIRLGFKEYKKVLDLSALQPTWTDDSTYKNRYEMLSVRQLSKAIDSLEKRNNAIEQRTKQDVGIYLDFTKYIDSNWSAVTIPAIKEKTFSETLPDSARTNIIDQSVSYANNLKTSLEIASSDYISQRKELRLHLAEWHQKYTMSIAVLVMFLIGAPLGSIVRKGGIGTPVVFAVIFFVIFFLLINFGKKFVREDVLQPVAGMWLATAVLVPIGLFLTYKAMHDSQLLNKEFYYRFYRKVQSLRKKIVKAEA
ncbi:MAG TPA: LptF/LptG family permease [Flavitalea sp.]|nr:LptF/LptG family permease [Flavitalea sp.]